jgi:hypothetical protein
MRHTLLIFLLIPLTLFSQPEETEQQKQMAAQMAKYMDAAWEADPEPGNSNIRFLMTHEGEPVAGISSIHGRYSLSMDGKMSHRTAFNPNENGKYVYEGLPPGTYSITVIGQYESEGFTWSKEGIEVKAGESPIVEIEVD